MAESGDAATWAELDRAAIRWANHFHELGLRAGDPIAFCIENRPEFVALVWACQYAGYRYTPISTRLTPAEVAYIVDDCGAATVVVSERTGGCRAAVADLGRPIAVVDVDGVERADEVEDFPRYERVEGIAMLYSSGTTGRPKGVWKAAPSEPIETLPPGDAAMASGFGIGSGSVYLSTAPLYHSAPLDFLLQMGRIGTCTVVMERFDPGGALAAIERFGVTHSQWVPTMFIRLLRLTDEERARHDLSSHVWAIHGAGPCPIPVKEAMLDWWGPIIHEYYAGTEGAGLCLIGPEEWLAHKGSVGRSVRGPALILDDEGRELPPGEVGQIWFGGGRDFRYHGDAAKTAQATGAEGTRTFGDVGYLDDEGYLYLTDRTAFTVNVGGINVSPREVEEVLLAHVSVHDVAVFGIPNAEYGDDVKAVVQPGPGVAAGPALESELIEHCREHLASYKLPRSIDFVADFPREPTGKVRIGLLRQAHLEAEE